MKKKKKRSGAGGRRDNLERTSSLRHLEGQDQFSNPRMLVGVAWSPGGRAYMQDTFCLVLSQKEETVALSTPSSTPPKNENEVSVERTKDEIVDFLGVFDGHGQNGENVSRFVARNICDIVMHKASAEGLDFCQAISEGCLELDELLRGDADLARDSSGRVTGGTTALAAWFRRGNIYIANAGDSRMVLSLLGEAVTVTDDHKPSAGEEKLRILRAGGYVSNDRVMETLAVARSFGDFGFKERASLGARDQMVTAVPDITIVRVVEDLDFVVLATDGVWDVMTDQEVVDFVREDFIGRRTDDVAGACARLLEACKGRSKRRVTANGATVVSSDVKDNMTVVVGIMK